jgi:hypothetical protein
MAVTSPYVSNQDATPVTPQTVTGAQRSLSAKEKQLNTAPGDGNPEDAEPGAQPSLIPTPSISYFRSPRAQARALSFRPEPTAPELIRSPGTAGPETSRAEAIQGPTPKQELTGPSDVPIAGDLAAEEEGVAASEAERANFGYWRHGRVTEPEKYAPAALAASQAAVKSFATVVTEKVGDLSSSVPAINPQVLDEDGVVTSDAERATFGYWRHGRVVEPDKYAPAALANVATTLKDVGSTVAGKLENLEPPIPAFLPQPLDEEDGAVASDAERASFGYWSHGRVAEPSKYSPAALANLPTILKGRGTGATKEMGNLGPIVVPVAIPQAAYGTSSRAQPTRKAVSEHSSSEYSDDYRSATISFHSSHETLSSGQRKPLIGVRNAVSSPYL